MGNRASGDVAGPADVSMLVPGCPRPSLAAWPIVGPPAAGVPPVVVACCVLGLGHLFAPLGPLASPERSASVVASR